MNDDREYLEALLHILQEQELDALTMRFGESRYELIRSETSSPAPSPPPSTAHEPVQAPLPQREPAPSAAYRKVTAPIVGVFYRAPSPDAAPFVEVGDRVEVGQVVCILEAMKLMNEITSDHAGAVRRILPENGALVSLGEDILWIEP